MSRPPVQHEWLQLAAATPSPPAFDLTMIAELPEAARRWLAHAIAPGTPLWQSVELRMHGQVKLGRWWPFTARQVVALPGGYIWAATARLAGLPLTGFDRLSSGTGQMRWRLLGAIPVMTASGTDITRSACGRLASEMTFLPTAFGQAAWAPGQQADATIATWQFDDDTEAIELRVGDRGQLTELMVSRWGNPLGEPFGRYPFGATVEAESEFRGVTIPSALRAGWWHGTAQQQEGEFFRAEITSAAFN